MFPKHAFLTEESDDDRERLNNDYVWIVDPIDGTKDFIERYKESGLTDAWIKKISKISSKIHLPLDNFKNS